MANKPKLSLDKEQLARLQEEQLQAITGGDVEFTKPIDIKTNYAAIDGGETDSVENESCCKKSCRGGD
ncbi:MAG: class I lanthipeptide [Bacteroidota bacterium]